MDPNTRNQAYKEAFQSEARQWQKNHGISVTGATLGGEFPILDTWHRLIIQSHYLPINIP